MGTVLLALGVTLVGATAVLAASCLRLGSAVGFLLASYVVASAEIVVVSLALSTVGALTRSALLVAIGALLAVAIAAWTRSGSSRDRLFGASYPSHATLFTIELSQRSPRSQSCSISTCSSSA